jgi:hypothetical protein
MAGDQGIARAYADYFAAQEELNLANDPFYQFTELATRAAQEWKFEKDKDAERAKKRADVLMDKSTEMFMNALDGYNPQGQKLGYDHLENFTNRMNAAAAQGDKKLMNQIYSETQAFANQLKQGQSILAEHAKNTSEGTYSEGAGTTTLNKFINGDYEVFMDTNPMMPDGETPNPNYNKLHFKIKGEKALPEVMSFENLDKGNVKRADAFGELHDQQLLKLSKQAFDTGLENWNDYEGDMAKLYKRSLADTDILYSAWHDDIFGYGESLASMYNKEHRNENRSWQFIYNEEPTAGPGDDPKLFNSGFDEEKMRVWAQEKLMELSKKEFNKRVVALNKKASGGNDHTTLTSGSKINYVHPTTKQNRTATGQQGIVAINWFKNAENGDGKTMYNGTYYEMRGDNIFTKNQQGQMVKINPTAVGDELGLLGYPQWDILWK